jgi:hypothetical protein
MDLNNVVESITHGTIIDLVIDYRLFTRRGGFVAFLDVLQSSTTIETVECPAYYHLGITGPMWVNLVRAIGGIRTLSRLSLGCDCEAPGARYWGNRLTEVAAAVQGATNLRELSLLSTVRHQRPLDGVQALAHALEQLPALQKFVWSDTCRPNVIRINLDPVIDTLVNRCPQLGQVDITTRCASDGAMASLLRVGVQETDTSLRLVLNTHQWAAVTGAIAACRCHVRRLTLVVGSHEVRADDDGLLIQIRDDMLNGIDNLVTTLAGAIREADMEDGGNPNLAYLTLELPGDGIRISAAAGIALAAALAANRTLRLFSLVNANFGANSYGVLRDMLRLRTNLVLVLPRLLISENQLVKNAHSRMMIVQRLNQAGSGRLLNQMTREVMLDILNDLIRVTAADPPELQVECINHLVQANPSVLVL